MLKEVIDASKFIGVQTSKKEFNGEEVTFLEIPMEINGIRYGKHGVILMEFYIHARKPNPYNQTHYLSLYYPKVMTRFREKMEELGYKDQIKYMGYIQKWGKARAVSVSNKETDIDKAFEDEN